MSPGFQLRPKDNFCRLCDDRIQKKAQSSHILDDRKHAEPVYDGP
jgi:hypothetical protein